MSDRELRVLEREGVRGDPAARRRLLRAQVRAGTIPADRVTLLALLGDEVAASLAPVGRERTARAWVEALSPWGEELLVGVAVAAASLALPTWAEGPETSDRLECWERTGSIYGGRWVTYELDPERAFAAAEAWLACPCAACGAEARRVSTYTSASRRSWWVALGEPYANPYDPAPLTEHDEAARSAAQSAGFAAQAAGATSTDSVLGLVRASLAHATTAAAWAWEMSPDDAWPSVRASAGAIVLGWLSSLPT